MTKTGTNRWCKFVIVLALATGLGAARPAGSAGAFRFEEKEDKFLELFDGDELVVVYNFGMLLKEGAPASQRRSSYVHPIYGLDGEVLSDDFPRDHYHHRGLFWAWAQVTVDGKTHDPWAVSGMATRFEKWLGRRTGARSARFGVNNGWYVGDKKVVDEKVRFRVRRSDAVGRPIDVDLTIEATDQPVVIQGRPEDKKGYGGFGFRFAPREGRAAITTVAGRAAKDVVRDPSPWADYSARFRDRPTTSGVTIFVHKSHPGFPTGWLLRHYGYIGLTWPGLDKVTLEKGKPVHLRYRVYVHRGDAVAGRVAEAYEAYIKSP